MTDFQLPPRDFTRTKTALRAYDATVPEFLRRWDAMADNAEFYALMHDMKALSDTVGEAVADDTADINSRSAARCMQPCRIDFTRREFQPSFDTSGLWAWIARAEGHKPTA